MNTTERWTQVGDLDSASGPSGRPQGVAGLAADPAWQLSVLAAGRWSVAERSFQHGGHQWVVGLTPAQASVALIVWRDEEVVAHARGDEAAMCRAALDWVSKILAEPPTRQSQPTTASGPAASAG